MTRHFEDTGIGDQPVLPAEPAGGPPREVAGTKILVQLPGARMPYTYLARVPVKAGDKVQVPGAFWMPRDSTQVGEVLSLGSDYAGRLTEILGVVT